MATANRQPTPTEATAPVLELRNVKYAEFASQETSCYTATLYVDGRKFCEVSNDGHGGGDYQYPIKGGVPPSKLNAEILALALRINPLAVERYENKVPVVREFSDEDWRKEYAGAWWTRGSHTAIEILEAVCARLLTEHLIRRDLVRSFKRKVLFTKPDQPGMFELPHRGRPDEAIAHLAKKYPGAVILNAKPLPEAVEWMRDYQEALP